MAQTIAVKKSSLGETIQEQNKWEERFLNPIQTQYNAGVESVNEMYDTTSTLLKTSRDVSVSQAYTNYKKSQREIDYSQNISTGFKDKLNQQYEQEYSGDYYNIQSQYQSGERQLLDDYSTQMVELNAQRDEAFTDYSESLEELSASTRDIMYAGLDYATENNIPGFSGLTQEKLLEEGYYTFQTNSETNNEQLVLTDKGRALWHTIFYGDMSDTSFSENLRMNNPKLWEQYVDNPELFQRAISGLQPTYHSTMSAKELFPEQFETMKIDQLLSEVNVSYSEVLEREPLDQDGIKEVFESAFTLYNVFKMARITRSDMSDNEKFREYMEEVKKKADEEGFAVIDASPSPLNRKEYLYKDGKFYKLEKNEISALDDYFVKLN